MCSISSILFSRPHLPAMLEFHAAEIFPAPCTEAASDSLSLTRACMSSSVPAHPPHVVHKPYHSQQATRSILGQNWAIGCQFTNRPKRTPQPGPELAWRVQDGPAAIVWRNAIVDLASTANQPRTHCTETGRGGACHPRNICAEPLHAHPVLPELSCIAAEWDFGFACKVPGPAGCPSRHRTRINSNNRCAT